jgi:hypothetical protein
MFRQRVFAISNGYPDGNDAAQLADDLMLKLACQRTPADDPLASETTTAADGHGPGCGTGISPAGRAD